MPISNKHDCLFVHIPRTGGVSIENALGLFREDRSEDLPALSGWIQSEELRQMGFVSPVLHHLTLQEIARLLPADELARCFVFSIVRNPWDRILSIYLFERKHARHYHPVGYEFPPLADYLDQLNPFYSLQQADFLAGPRQPDYVGRFEYLAEDFAHIANQIGLEGTQLPHLNHTSHEHYSSYYCDKTREKVARLFHKDIEQFGYSFEQR